MSTQLRTALVEHLAAVAPPPGDVELARRDGTRRRRRRRAGTAAGVAGLVTALAVGVLQVQAPERGTVVEDYPSLGRLDFSGGLRAYADPGGTIWIGSRSFDASEVDYLDTDAVGTPYGVVFYDAGRPMLLDEQGEVSALVEGPVGSHPDFHPTAKADSVSARVAWAVLRDGTATITVRDLVTGEDLAALDVDCGTCDDLVIDALDEGVVFFRAGGETRIWDITNEFSYAFAGAETRVADVRNGTLLYDGPAPTGVDAERYLTIPAPVDAQLTFDGRYILYWSSVLQNTRSGVAPVRLEVGPRKTGALGFWTLDTDGSVLVAALDGKYPNYLVSDCEVPSGACVDVGRLKPTGGDPMFIGNDM